MFCAGRDVGMPILPVPTDFSTVIERVNIHDKQVTYETVSVCRTLNGYNVTTVRCLFLILIMTPTMAMMMMMMISIDLDLV